MRFGRKQAERLEPEDWVEATIDRCAYSWHEIVVVEYRGRLIHVMCRGDVALTFAAGSWVEFAREEMD